MSQDDRIRMATQVETPPPLSPNNQTVHLLLLYHQILEIQMAFFNAVRANAAHEWKARGLGMAQQNAGGACPL
jgi:hypothetical protein